MGGNTEYKESWTRRYKESICLTLARPGTRSQAYKGIEFAKGMGKSLLRATVPETIRIAGHRLITQRHYNESTTNVRESSYPNLSFHERPKARQARMPALPGFCRTTATETDKFEISIASPDDRDNIIRLMGRIYPGDMAARYAWLYESNPHGGALSWIA